LPADELKIDGQHSNVIKDAKRWEIVGSALACYGSSLCSNPDISQKYKMGDISKEVSNTL
jgi:hypothetical protein